MRSFGKLVCVGALLGGVSLPAAAEARIWETTFRGQWACKDREAYVPMAGVRVELYRRLAKWSPRQLDTKVGETFTDEDGAYSFHTRTRSSEAHDFYPVVPLEGLKDWPFIAREYTTRFQVDDVPQRDFGVAIIDDPRCAVWMGFVKALRDYKNVVDDQFATGGYNGVLYHAPTAGKPFALYDTVWWPPGTPPSRHEGGFDTARHEFAHTFRHVMDGDFEHWLVDVAAHLYAQHHDACKLTNQGFAFNEGWAKYWAGDGKAYRGEDGVMRPPCSPGDDMRYEGNVAAALENLQTSCKLTRGQMVAVLRRAPGRIHNFSAFKARTKCVVSETGPPLAVAEGDVRSLSLKKHVQAGRLRARQLSRATRGTRRVLSAAGGADCPKRPCAEIDLRRVLLRGELAQVALLRKTLAFETSKAKLKKLRRQGPAKLARTYKRMRSTYGKSALALARRTLSKSTDIAKRVRGGKPMVSALRAVRSKLASADALPAALVPGVAAQVAEPAGPTPDPAPSDPGQQPPSGTEPEPQPGTDPDPQPGTDPEEPPGPVGPAPDPQFADWTGVSANTASGTLNGASISVSGSSVSDPPGSVVDGSSTVFDRSDFTPSIARSDAIHFSGGPGYAYTLQFGAPRHDPVLHLASLASKIEFPAGTQVTRVSGDAEFSAADNTVTGGVQGSDDANGTVRLNGTFDSVSFSATPTYSGPPDGIYLQVGAAPQ